MTGNGAKIWIGDEKSLVEVHRKSAKISILSELACSSVCLMVRGFEMEPMLWYYCGRSVKNCRL